MPNYCIAFRGLGCSCSSCSTRKTDAEYETEARTSYESLSAEDRANIDALASAIAQANP